ncbi:MAG: BatA domain-containing protein [Verrucomicrobiaceae bacterium]|nr:BatA domain-containing protein [Verrucomicrobiaceae bacterium]
MTWLFPLYLAGAAAIVLPILLHLRRRPPKERVVFSSLMFLEKTPEILTKRSKLEQLLLLALRCLALILLAIMFARPFVRGKSDATATGKGEAVVLLLDTSASMRRGDLWQQAMKTLEKRVNKATLADRVAVARFDRETKTLWSFDQDAKSAGSRVASIEAAMKTQQPGWSATDLGRALVDAAGSFQRSGSSAQVPAFKRIVLISDLQDGARLDALRGFAWPDDVEVEIASVSLPNTDNLTLSLAAAESEDESAKIQTSAAAKTTPGVRVRVSNVRESKTESFSLQWDKGTGAPQTGYLPAGASRVLRTSPAPNNIGGDVLTLTGDAWDFDNRICVAPPQPREARVVFLGNSANANEAASPLYYLTRALQPTPALKPVLEVGGKLAAEQSGTDLQSVTRSPAQTLIKPSDPKSPNIAFVQGGGVDAAALTGLKSWIEQGGFGVLVLPADANEKELSALAELKSLTVIESTGSEYAMLGDVDTTHPLLRPFADARLRDFTKIRFWLHRVVKWKDDEPNKPQVLAKFDNGDPAMLLWQRGKGKVLVLTSGWHPADSQLALSTKFVPLLFGWLEAAGFSHEAAQSLLVGDALPLGDAAAAIVKPDGSKVDQASGVVTTDMPGFFKIAQGGESKIVAVNLPPEEGRIHPMEPAKLAEAGVKLTATATAKSAAQSAADKQRLDASEEEARQRLWLWVLILLLAVLVWETWLAGRKRASQTVPA